MLTIRYYPHGLNFGPVNDSPVGKIGVTPAQLPKLEPCPACGRPWVPHLTRARVPLDIRCACCQVP